MEIYPSGTVTFLFTDIEGSTSLARADPDHWEALRQQHHAILLSAIETHHGYAFQIIGDAFCAAFSKASDALQAASAAQTGLQANHWGAAPIKVRMGIHTGSAEVQASGEYNGYVTLSRVQRIMSAGHGGQTLLSQATQELVRDELPENLSLHDLGEHRLKDLIHPEHIFQLNTPGLPDEFPPIKTLDRYRHNLPVQLTSFIGREKEITEIKQALAEHHLVTLTGPGGAGKTRLSLQVAAELIDGFADGAWFVDLAPLTDPALVPHAVASALNLREEGAAPLMDLLANYLQRRELLIVLDNCEHLVEASARAADLLLHASPQLKIIATSREGLGVAGEKTFPVPSLSFSSIRRPSPAALSQYEATRLFIDRALLVQPHFSVNNENAPAVAQICYRLDGIPLAIELAAARVKAMSAEQIATRLDDSFRLLTGGSRTALPRQQTLRAMIDWSWELLSENERRLLPRLSVFAGGWTLEAAEMVCAGDGIEQLDILDLLSQLVSKSLVIWHEQQDESRYQLLETIRQYAHTKLCQVMEPGAESQVRTRHAEYYAQFSEQAAANFYSVAQKSWLKRLELEHDNFRAAMDWLVDSSSPLALKIAIALGDYLFYRDLYEEGIQWYERALNANPEASMELRAYALGWAAVYYDQTGRIELADQRANACLDLANQTNDQALLASALFVRGVIYVEGGAPQSANDCFSDALPLSRATSSPFVLPGLLMYMGLMLSATGDYAGAEAYFQEAAEIANNLYASCWQPLCLLFLGSLALLKGDSGKARADLVLGIQLAEEVNINAAHAVEMLGRVEIVDSNLAEARIHLTQSLVALQDLVLRPCLAHGLESWARLALAQGEPERAAQLLGAIAVYMKGLGMNMIPIEQALYDQTLAAVQKELDPAKFQQEWAAGEKLNVDQAIELAMG